MLPILLANELGDWFDEVIITIKACTTVFCAHFNKHVKLLLNMRLIIDFDWDQLLMTAMSFILKHLP